MEAEMTKQEILNELARCYALQREGKKVKTLIRELEQELWLCCDDELDEEASNETNKKNRKVRNGR